MIEIQTAITSLGAVRDLVKVGFDAKVDAKASEKVIDAMGRLGQASDTLYALRDELFRLQAENTELKRDAEKSQAFAARLEGYELTKTAGGAIVWRFKADPEHYACPSCLNDGRIEILQTNRTRSGKYRCTVKDCGAEYPVEPIIPMKPINYGGGNAGGSQGWMGS
jgi:predicted RNA-binding Zn-ribbon protein involved in translation (DUF1610 family)